MRAPSIAAISAAQQARIKQDSRDKEAAEAFRWLESHGVSFIEFRNGDGLDVANHPGGLLDAIWQAKQGETHA